MPAQTALARFETLFPQRKILHVSPENIEQLYSLSAPGPAGCDVILDAGEYVVTRTIRIPSNTRIIGAGRSRTTLILAPGSNCHLMTNADHGAGNANVFIGAFHVIGNAADQERPADWKPLTFCCAIYIKKMNSIVCADLSFFDIRQTCLHFNSTVNALILEVEGRRMGWSGVSTSNASNMYVNCRFEEAGLDVIHSAIHLDGGSGVFVDAVVRDTVGNGIMLDSTFGPLSGCAVRGLAERCKRGVSLSGSANNPLINVSIEGIFRQNTDAGVMVSNSQHVVLSGCSITENKGYGLLFQGRNGGNNCTVSNCDISGNGTDIGHLHASRENWVFPRTEDALSFFSVDVNARSVRTLFGQGKGWFGNI